MSFEEFKKIICPKCIYYKQHNDKCELHKTIKNTIKCVNYKRGKKNV